MQNVQQNNTQFVQRYIKGMEQVLQELKPCYEANFLHANAWFRLNDIARSLRAACREQDERFRLMRVAIVGAGNLGQAIANYTNFERRGFIIKGMFDINPKLIGLVIRGIEIRSVDDLESFIRENEIQIAALTIPKTKAPEIADRLVKAGIKAIWNFAHTDLVVPDDVVVENVHLSESLMRLSYRVCSMQDKKKAGKQEK